MKGSSPHRLAAKPHRTVFCAVVALTVAACAKHDSAAGPQPTEPKDVASDPQATGLRPPTAAEQAAMDKEMIKTGEVRPNRLGLERINAERAKNGLPPLKIEPAPDGKEVVPKPPQ